MKNFELLMSDNKQKDEKIAELEDRIAALEQNSLTNSPDDDKKNKTPVVPKAVVTNRMKYICTRIENSNTITQAVFDDLLKYTTYNDHEDPKTVDARRDKTIKAFNKIWTTLAPTNTDITYDQDTWITVLQKIENIVGVTDKDIIASILLDN
jgi:hypothetical protein